TPHKAANNVSGAREKARQAKTAVQAKVNQAKGGAKTFASDVKNAGKATASVGKGLVRDIKHHESTKTTLQHLKQNGANAGKAVGKGAKDVTSVTNNLNVQSAALNAAANTKLGKAVKKEVGNSAKSMVQEKARQAKTAVQPMVNQAKSLREDVKRDGVRK